MGALAEEGEGKRGALAEGGEGEEGGEEGDEEGDEEDSSTHVRAHEAVAKEISVAYAGESMDSHGGEFAGAHAEEPSGAQVGEFLEADAGTHAMPHAATHVAAFYGVHHAGVRAEEYLAPQPTHAATHAGNLGVQDEGADGGFKAEWMDEVAAELKAMIKMKASNSMQQLEGFQGA